MKPLHSPRPQRLCERHSFLSAQKSLRRGLSAHAPRKGRKKLEKQIYSVLQLQPSVCLSRENPHLVDPVNPVERIPRLCGVAVTSMPYLGRDQADVIQIHHTRRRRIDREDHHLAQVVQFQLSCDRCIFNVRHRDMNIIPALFHRESAIEPVMILTTTAEMLLVSDRNGYQQGIC